MRISKINLYSNSMIKHSENKRQDNSVAPKSFGSSGSTAKCKAIKGIALATLMGLSAVFMNTSCSQPTGSDSTQQTTTTEPTEPTNPTEPTEPTEPVVTHSPVQTQIVSLLKILVLGDNITETSDIDSFGYYDESDNTQKTLNLNSDESTNAEQVYDGTVASIDDSETIEQIRLKITNPSEKEILVRSYYSTDGLPLNETSALLNYTINYRYVFDTDSNSIKKYSINPDGTIKNQLATIYPDSSNSLVVETTNGDVYALSDIDIKTK